MWKKGICNILYSLGQGIGPEWDGSSHYTSAQFKDSFWGRGEMMGKANISENKLLLVPLTFPADLALTPNHTFQES